MRIIKHGNIPECLFTCPMCGCEFAARVNECESEYMFAGHSIRILKIKCPDCHTLVTAQA